MLRTDPSAETLPPEPSSTIPRNDQETTNGCSARPAGSEANNKVHLVLQGKGGVGKTYVASLIAQYLQETGRSFFCIDTDPVNASLCGFAALAATPVRLLDRDRLDVDALDAMLDWILASPDSVVIDNGAASFLPLSRYLVENDIPALLAGHGRAVVVHTIVTGGPAMLDTAKALAAILGQYPAHVRVVVWLNAFFGPVLTDSGAPFEDTPLYRTHQQRIEGLVRLDALDPDSTGRTLAQMLARRLTFAEAEASPDFRIVARRRLRQVKQAIWAQLAQVL